MIIKETKPFSRPSTGLDPAVSRVVSIRVPTETLKRLRIAAAEQDMTVSSLLKREAERLAMCDRKSH
jgi:hypothetical protein